MTVTLLSAHENIVPLHCERGRQQPPGCSAVNACVQSKLRNPNGSRTNSFGRQLARIVHPDPTAESEVASSLYGHVCIAEIHRNIDGTLFERDCHRRCEPDRGRCA